MEWEDEVEIFWSGKLAGGSIGRMRLMVRWTEKEEKGECDALLIVFCPPSLFLLPHHTSHQHMIGEATATAVRLKDTLVFCSRPFVDKFPQLSE